MCTKCWCRKSATGVRRLAAVCGVVLAVAVSSSLTAVETGAPSALADGIYTVTLEGTAKRNYQLEIGWEGGVVKKAYAFASIPADTVAVSNLHVIGGAITGEVRFATERDLNHPKHSFIFDVRMEKGKLGGAYKAYMWNDLRDHSGPVSATMRAWNAGPGGRDFPFARYYVLPVFRCAGVFEIWHTGGSGYDPGGPMTMAGPRGGRVSGQAVFDWCGDAPKNVVATVSDLKQKGGAGVISRSNLQIRYGTRSRDLTGRKDVEPVIFPAYETLSEEYVPAGDPLLPVWVTASIPRNAAPGMYEGELTVLSWKVPIQVRVADFLMPERKDHSLMVSTMQSPDSVALRYGVKPYSEEHLKLLERSLACQAIAGTDVLIVPIARDGIYGTRNSMVPFRKTGTELTPDFRFFEKYLELFVKHCGTPRAVVLQVWEDYMHGRANDAFGRVHATQLDEQGNPQPVLLDMYPANKDAWKALVVGVLDRLDKHGVKHEAVRLGMCYDEYPGSQAISMFREVAPDLNWSVWSHYTGLVRKDDCLMAGNGDAKIRLTHLERACWRSPTKEGCLRLGWNQKFNELLCPRGNFFGGAAGYTDARGEAKLVNSQTPYCTARLLPDISVYLGPKEFQGGIWNACGYGKVGLDFWMLPVEEKMTEPVNDRNTLDGKRGWWSMSPFWPQLWMTSSAYAMIKINIARLHHTKILTTLTAPGPKGALALVRLELLGEGAQETEIRCWIEKAIVSGAAGKELSDRYLRLGRYNGLIDKSGDNTPYKDVYDLIFQTGNEVRIQKGYEELMDLAVEIQKHTTKPQK